LSCIFSDICAGYAAGIRPILVLTGLGHKHLFTHAHEAPGSFLVARDLSHATDLILAGRYHLAHAL